MPNVGDVVEISLPDGKVAHARVLRDASIAVYRGIRTAGQSPPLGSREYAFVVGVYEDALRGLPVVGKDPNRDESDGWPPPYRITDPITGSVSLYYRGTTRPASADEAEGLEPAAVWDLAHIVKRIESEVPPRDVSGERSPRR